MYGVSLCLRNVSFLLQVKADGRSHTDKTPSRRRVSWHHLLATSHTQPCHFPAPGSSRPENTLSKDVVCGLKKCCSLGRLGEPTHNDYNSHYFVFSNFYLFFWHSILHQLPKVLCWDHKSTAAVQFATEIPTPQEGVQV